MKYVIQLEKYDYFGGASTTEYKSYSELLEFWKEFKRLKRMDYNNDDSYQSTNYYTVHEDPVEVPPQRPHARSKYEWEKISSACSQPEEKLAPFDFELNSDEEKIDLFGDIDSEEEDDDLFRYI